MRTATRMPSDGKGIKELMEPLNSRVLSSSARLDILIALYYERKMSFSFLAFHLQVLEEKGANKGEEVLNDLQGQDSSSDNGQG